MVNIGSEHTYITSILLFYGFLYLLFTLNGNSLYGLNLGEITYSEPVQDTGNVVIDLINNAGQTINNIKNFFWSLFITPFSSSGGAWAYFGFLNWAIFGTMIYLFIRVIRGGG